MSALDDKYWTIIGSGSIGAKAEELRKKTSAIVDAGFTPNPRIVLAMGFFEEFRKRNGIDRALARGASSEELTELVSDTPFQEPELRAIRHLVKLFRRDFPGVPLVIRSSAHGDCRGTGIYESEFCPHFRNEQKTIGALMRAIKRVLESEFSESAIAFRKDLDLPGGMAVIIEPVFGQKIQGRYQWGDKAIDIFGPSHSGYAYSSTASGSGNGFIVSGLPTQAVAGGGFRINEGQEERFEDILYRSFFEMRNSDERIASYAGDKVIEWRHGEWLSPVSARMNHGVSARNAWIADRYFPDWLFCRLKKLEALLGKPQYVEFAFRETGAAPEIAILQIADVNKKTDFFEFPQTGNSVIRSNFVVGTGSVTCHKAVCVFNPDDIYLLHDFNQKNKGYLVIYGGRLTSIMLKGHSTTLRYNDLSNASALVEIAECHHSRHPKAHFEGMIDETGKILMVTREIDWEVLEPFQKLMKKKNGVELRIYDAEFRATASERRQKGIVELIG